MKKIILYILTPFLILPAFTSCDSMLEEVNYGNPTMEDMLSNEQNAVLLVGQAYADVKWVHDHWGYWGVSSLTSDECLCPVRIPGEHWADGGYWENLNTHNWNEFGDAFKNIWNTTISGAVLCNKLIDALKEVTVFNPAPYVGELEILRSYYYYMLFDCFGRIPYKETFDSNPEPLMEVPMVWSKLVSSLEKNAPNLPKVTNSNREAYYGRVTRGFAYGLLARLFLNANSYGCTPENIDPEVKEHFQINSMEDFYTNCVKYCDEVIKSGSYSIEENYFTNFKIHNEGSRENMFVIVEDGSADFDLRSIGSMSNKLRLTILTSHYSMQKSYNLLEKPWNGFCARPSYLELFDKRDVRGTGDEGKGTLNEKQWGWFVGPVYDAAGKKVLLDENGTPANIVPEITSLSEALWNEGARMNKYEVDKTSKYQYCENDFVLMRYADVLWMKEEAIVRGGTGTSGVNTADFQRMLKRAFAYEDDPEAAFEAAYPALLELNMENIDEILDERGREFSWELVRRRDLIRFDKFEDPDYVQYVSNSKLSRRWFPIPYSVLQKSLIVDGKPLWTQNEGY